MNSHHNRNFLIYIPHFPKQQSACRKVDRLPCIQKFIWLNHQLPHIIHACFHCKRICCSSEKRIRTCATHGCGCLSVSVCWQRCSVFSVLPVLCADAGCCILWFRPSNYVIYNQQHQSRLWYHKIHHRHTHNQFYYHSHQHSPLTNAFTINNLSHSHLSFLWRVFRRTATSNHLPPYAFSLFWVDYITFSS